MPEIARKIVLWLIFQLALRSEFVLCLDSGKKCRSFFLNMTKQSFVEISTKQKSRSLAQARMLSQGKNKKLSHGTSGQSEKNDKISRAFFATRRWWAKKSSFATRNEIKHWWFIVIFRTELHSLALISEISLFIGMLFSTPSRARPFGCV